MKHQNKNTKPRGWLGEHLRIDLFCVELDMKPINQSTCNLAPLVQPMFTVSNKHEFVQKCSYLGSVHQKPQ